MRSCGTSSTYRPPKEWLWSVVKFVNDILCVPPTLASSWWTLPVKPFGGNHLAIASGSRNARNPLGRSTQHTVQADGISWHGLSPFVGDIRLQSRSAPWRVDKERQQVIEVIDELISARHSSSR